MEAIAEELLHEWQRCYTFVHDDTAPQIKALLMKHHHHAKLNKGYASSMKLITPRNTGVFPCLPLCLSVGLFLCISLLSLYRVLSLSHTHSLALSRDQSELVSCAHTHSLPSQVSLHLLSSRQQRSASSDNFTTQMYCNFTTQMIVSQRK